MSLLLARQLRLLVQPLKQAVAALQATAVIQEADSYSLLRSVGMGSAVACTDFANGPIVASCY